MANVFIQNTEDLVIEEPEDADTFDHPPQVLGGVMCWCREVCVCACVWCVYVYTCVFSCVRECMCVLYVCVFMCA